MKQGGQISDLYGRERERETGDGGRDLETCFGDGSYAGSRNGEWGWGRGARQDVGLRLGRWVS